MAASLLGSGSYEFTLRHGDSIVFTGLVDGIHYDIVENSSNEDAYTTTAVGTGEVLTDPLDREVHVRGTLDKEASIEFVNDRNVAVPTKVSPTSTTLWLIIMIEIVVIVIRRKRNK